MWFEISVFMLSMFFLVRGILKFVLWRRFFFFYFDTGLFIYFSLITSAGVKFSFFTSPISSSRFSISCWYTNLSFCRICFTLGIRRISSLKVLIRGSEHDFATLNCDCRGIDVFYTDLKMSFGSLF
jgi:hypothetical protein